MTEGAPPDELLSLLDENCSKDFLHKVDRRGMDQKGDFL